MIEWAEMKRYYIKSFKYLTPERVKLYKGEALLWQQIIFGIWALKKAFRSQ